MLFIEIFFNLLLCVIDIKKFVEIVKEYGLILVVDNIFMIFYY